MLEVTMVDVLGQEWYVVANPEIIDLPVAKTIELRATREQYVCSIRNGRGLAASHVAKVQCYAGRPYARPQSHMAK